MIRIAPEELAFAERLSKIRRKYKPSDGAKSWPRYHQLVYEGGDKLTFRTTDLRISMVSKLPVEGEDVPWECRVFQENFDTLAKFVDGGRLTLNPSPASCVRVEKGVPTTRPNANGTPILPLVEDVPILPNVENAQPFPAAEGAPTVSKNEPGYRYPFWRVLIDTPFPEMLSIDPEHPGMQISLDKLRRALRFLAGSRKERDPNCRLNICSILPNQQVCTWHDGVFIQTEGPIVDAPINLASSDAFRLGQWLQLLHSRKEEKLLVARATDEQGRTTVLFATPGIEHRFQVLGLTRSFPVEYFTNVRAAETTIRGTLSRQELRTAAGWFSQFIDCRLNFHFKKNGDQWTLLQTPSREVPRSGGPVAIRVLDSPNGCQEIPHFQVSVGQLLTSVEYHEGEDLHFTLRQRAKVFTLANKLEGDGGDGVGANQTHISVRFNATDE